MQCLDQKTKDDEGGVSTMIRGYDAWKTNEEETKAVCCCEYCGRALYEGDVLYTVNGEKMCEDCLNDEYRRLL